MANIKVVSRSAQPFRNREEAGQLLARELSDLRGKKAVVLGIPRGGIIVAQVLADAIDADLDIVLSRKLGAPYQQELAIGALSEHGELFLNRSVVSQLGIPSSYIEQERERQSAEIARRSRLVRAVKPKVSLKGKPVVVTDDGIATGATMQAAVWAIRDEEPKEIIVAAPVASEEAATRLAQDVEEVICLRLPPDFMAVGQFFLEFTQVTDEEMLEVLRQSERKRHE